MRVLVLEDSPERIREFKRNLIGCNVDITKNPNEAMQFLKEKSYDYIFLDCDLEENHYFPSYWTDKMITESKTTGVAVARFLEENPDLSKSATVVVHSLNPVGSKSMMKFCEPRGARYIPYYQLWDVVKVSR